MLIKNLTLNMFKKVYFTLLFLPFILTSTLVYGECQINRVESIKITKPDSRYLDSNNGTIIDIATGLMWQKCSLGQSGTNCESGTAQTFTWQAALASANQNEEYGYSDWRLPNINELRSLLEYACASPAINDSIFPNTPSEYFWTSSPSHTQTNFNWAWQVNFGSTYSTNSSKNSPHRVRLVRNN